MSDTEKDVVITVTVKNATQAGVDAIVKNVRGVGTEVVKAGEKAEDFSAAMRRISDASVSVGLKRITDLTREFAGTNAKQAAEEYAAAVTKLGGVAKLSAVHQEEVNRVVNAGIRAYQQAGDEVPAHLAKIAVETTKIERPMRQVGLETQKTTTFAGKLKEQFAGLATGSNGLLPNIQNLALGYITGQFALDAFYTAGRRALQFMGDSIHEALEADKAQRKLTSALERQGLAIPEVEKRYSDLARKYADITVHSDDVITATEALLTTVGGVLPSEMDKALEAATNLAAGLSKSGQETSLAGASELLAKALAGNGDELGRLKVYLKDVYVEGTGTAGVLDAINQKWGGEAQAEARSYAGQIQRVTNDFKDLEEQVGKVVLDLPGLSLGFTGARVAIGLISIEVEKAKYALLALQNLPGFKSIADAFAPSPEAIERVKAGQQAAAQSAATVEENIRLQRAAAAAAAERAAQEEKLHEAIKARHDDFNGTARALELKVESQFVRELTREQLAQGVQVQALVEKYVAWREAGYALPPALRQVIEDNKQFDYTLVRVNQGAFNLASTGLPDLTEQIRAQGLAAMEAAGRLDLVGQAHRANAAIALAVGSGPKATRDLLKYVSDQTGSITGQIEEQNRKGMEAADRERDMRLRLREISTTSSKLRLMQIDEEWQRYRAQFPGASADIDELYKKFRARAVWDEVLGNLNRLGRGFQSAGEMMDSHFLTALAKGLDYFQRIVSTVSDLVGSIRNITSMMAGGGGFGGGGGGGIPGLGGGLNFGSLLRGGGVKGLLGLGGGVAGGGGLLGGATSGLAINTSSLAAPGATAATGGGAGLGGLLTNPWTIGIGAGIGLALLGKKLWGDAGTDAVQDFMNKNTWNGQKGANAFHALLYEKLGVSAGEQLWIQGTQKLGKKDKAGAQAWEDVVISKLAATGYTGVSKYKTGIEYVPRTELALVHQGERIINAEDNARGVGRGGVVNNTNISITVNADGSVRVEGSGSLKSRLEQLAPTITNLVLRCIQNNHGGTATKGSLSWARELMETT